MSTQFVIPLADGLVIRPIEARDNQQLAQLITSVWAEFDNSTTYFDHPEVVAGIAPNKLTGPNKLTDEDYDDPKLKTLYQLYQIPEGQPMNRAYWVIADESNQRVLGGGGFDALPGPHPDAGICELQKLYFHTDLRGRGVGSQLMALILEHATLAGYKEMYLESILEMTGAIRLYNKFGFQSVPRQGSTGHWRCTVFMGRPLAQLDKALPASLDLAVTR
jgi:putative acetyltransferase